MTIGLQTGRKYVVADDWLTVAVSMTLTSCIDVRLQQHGGKLVDRRWMSQINWKCQRPGACIERPRRLRQAWSAFPCLAQNFVGHTKWWVLLTEGKRCYGIRISFGISFDLKYLKDCTVFYTHNCSSAAGFANQYAYRFANQWLCVNVITIGCDLGLWSLAFEA